MQLIFQAKMVRATHLQNHSMSRVPSTWFRVIIKKKVCQTVQYFLSNLSTMIGRSECLQAIRATKMSKYRSLTHKHTHWLAHTHLSLVKITENLTTFIKILTTCKMFRKLKSPLNLEFWTIWTPASKKKRNRKCLKEVWFQRPLQ